MKKKQKQYIWALIMIGALIAYFATGCNSTRRISNSQTTAEQTTTENQTQEEQEQTITMTDTTRTDTGTTQKIIIEFREPIPAGPPQQPPPGADPNYYNFLLYQQLINQIKSIEQTTNQNTITRAGLDITDASRENIHESAKTATQATQTSESSNSEPVAITPAWVKSVRTAGIIILIIAAALLYIRYGGAIRRIFRR